MRAVRHALPPVVLFVVLLVLSTAPAAAQPESAPAPAVWDLGTLDAGKSYPTTVTARNRCPGRESFAVRVEGAPWLRITGAQRLKVRPGSAETTAARVDLSGVEPGDYRGTIRVECTSCRPPCTQDVEVIEVRLTVRVAETPAAAPGEAAPGESGPGQTAPGEKAPGEKAPGETAPGGAAPAETGPGETAPGESTPGETPSRGTGPGAGEPEATPPSETPPAAPGEAARSGAPGPPAPEPEAAGEPGPSGQRPPSTVPAPVPTPAPAACPSLPPAGAPHPWEGALADPEAAAERRELRRRLAELELAIDYWRRLCERTGADRDRAERNAATLAEMAARLAALAAELGVELPAEGWEEEACCPEAGCCAGIDPATEEGRAELIARQQCLIARFRALNRQLEATGLDFQALLERWRDGEGHRETMGAYHDLFQGLRDLIQGARDFRDAVQEVVDELTLEGAKAQLEEQLQQGACEGFGISPQECERLRERLAQAEDVKGFVDTIVDAAEGGEIPVELIVDMVDAMADAAVRATGVAVEGWKEFHRQMGVRLVESFRLLRCLEAVNAALAEVAAECPELCERAVAELEAEHRAVEAAIAASDEAERQRAQEWRQAAEAEIAAGFDRGMGAEKKAWFDACCDEREGEVQVQVRVPEDPANPACARLLDRLLRRWIGPPYCYMAEVEVTLDCRRPWTASGARFTYFPTVERQRGCCWQRPTEPPPERPLPPAEPEPAPPSRGGESTEPVDTPPPRKPPPVVRCDCRLAVTADGAAVAPGAVLGAAAGSRKKLSVRGTCGACPVASTVWSIVPPPLSLGGVPVPQPPARVLGPALIYRFADPGTHRLRVTQTCSDGATCRLDFEVRVPPGGGGGGPAAGAPGEPERQGACGEAPCLEVGWRAGDERGTIEAHRLRRPAPGEVELTLESTCLPACAAGRTVTWTVTGPGGTVVRRGAGLYSLRYDFVAPGSYAVCVAEDAGCGVPSLTAASTHLTVEVAPPPRRAAARAPRPTGRRSPRATAAPPRRGRARAARGARGRAGCRAPARPAPGPRGAW